MTIVEASLPSEGAGDGPPDDLAQLAGGTRVGRYIVMEPVGQGASGVVFAAYDPELDRKVALKLLGGVDDGEDRSHRDRRLLREAQAMARVHHPHVVAVHDVGVWNERVFVAMEFATGGTLRQWLAAAPRAWPEILACFRGAGEGLAAAHAAGLVHRDFKPDNVLLLDDGRAIVTDFGLARPTSSRAAASSSAWHLSTLPMHADSPHGPSLGQTLTQTGALVGTPAYMAPEQFEGATADARSDQFSFCVALFEALYGARPFPGATVAAVLEAMATGPTIPPSEHDVPRWLRVACVRGLGVDPGARHRDMRRLLAALRGPRRIGRRTFAVVGLGSAAIVYVALQARGPAEEAPARWCDDVAAKLDGVWDDGARSALHERFAATGLAFAPEVAGRVVAGLDTFASEWVAAQTEACRAGVEGTEDTGLLAARTTCLARQHAEFVALATALREADADTVMQAVDAAQGLPRVADCADARPGRSTLPPPSEAMLAAVARARGLMHESRALRNLGKHADSVARAEAAMAEAGATDYGPVVAEAKVELAEALMADGQPDRAEPLMHEGLSAALAAGHDRVVANAAREIAFLEMNRMADPAIIERWARTGLAALHGLGEADVDLRAELTDFLGTALRRGGDTEAAFATLREVLALRIAHRGPDHYTVAQSLASLGMAHARRGEFAEALAHTERARQILRDTYGEAHPSYGAMVQNLATTHFVHGDYATALALYDESHRLLVAALGERHPTVAVLAYNLATTLTYLERFDEAEQRVAEARDIEDARSGPESLQAASRHSLLGEIRLRDGRLADAEASIRAALAIAAKVAPTDRARRANYDSQLGHTLALGGRFDEASVLLERALAEQAEVVGEPSIEVAETSGRLAMVELARGRVSQARALVERSVAQYESEDPDPHQHAEAWFRHARILHAAGETAAARAQAERALRFHVGHDDQPGRRQEIERWLASTAMP